MDDKRASYHTTIGEMVGVAIMMATFLALAIFC